MKKLKFENEIYETPKFEIIEVESEGVLCGSGDRNGTSFTTGNYANGDSQSFTGNNVWD